MKTLKINMLDPAKLNESTAWQHSLKRKPFWFSEHRAGRGTLHAFLVLSTCCDIVNLCYNNKISIEFLTFVLSFILYSLRKEILKGLIIINSQKTLKKKNREKHIYIILKYMYKYIVLLFTKARQVYTVMTSHYV